MSRHDIRRLAFQTLFAMSSNPDAVATDVYQTVLGKDIEAPEYLTQLVDGVNEHLAEIDEAISAHLKKGWPISRLNKTELILRYLSMKLWNFQKNSAMRLHVVSSMAFCPI